MCFEKTVITDPTTKDSSEQIVLGHEKCQENLTVDFTYPQNGEKPIRPLPNQREIHPATPQKEKHAPGHPQNSGKSTQPPRKQRELPRPPHTHTPTHPGTHTHTQNRVGRLTRTHMMISRPCGKFSFADYCRRAIPSYI